MKYLELVLSNTHHPPNFALDKFNKTHYYSSWKSILVCTVLKPVQAGFVFSILDIVFSAEHKFFIANTKVLLSQSYFEPRKLAKVISSKMVHHSVSLLQKQ